MSGLPTWPDFTSWDGIPETLREGIAAYVTTGRRVGSFLTAVIENDFHQAVTRADDESLAALRTLAQFFYNQTPGLCWGSKANAEAWRTVGGIEGKEALRHAR